MRQESIVIRVSTSQLSLGNNTAIYTQDGFNDGTYRWWVRAFNSQGAESSWSNSQSFNVDAQASLDVSQPAPLNDLQILLSSFENEESEPKQNHAQPVENPQTPVETTNKFDEESDQQRFTKKIAADASSELLEIMVELADPSTQLLMHDRPDQS